MTASGRGKEVGVIKLVMTKEQCRDFVDDIFKSAIGKDFQYVLQAVKEKMIRDGEAPTKSNTDIIIDEATGE